MSNLVLWKQTDPRWANNILGYNTDPNFNLGQYGCLVSDLAMLVATATGDVSWTPARVNEFLKANSGFQIGGGLLIWSRVPDIFPFIQLQGSNASFAEAEAFVAAAEPNYAIFQVENGAHYVLAPYTNQIADPLTGTLRPANTYPFNNAHLFTVMTTPPPATPAPALPVTTRGTITVTAKPALNLRTGPGTNYAIGTGYDANGKIIHALPYGASVEYVSVVQGEAVNGNTKWLISNRGNHFSAAGTNYQ